MVLMGCLVSRQVVFFADAAVVRQGRVLRRGSALCRVKGLGE